jgi:hypothetical protein
MTDDIEKLRELQIAINDCLDCEDYWKKRREAYEREYRALSIRMGRDAAEKRNVSDD